MIFFLLAGTKKCALLEVCFRDWEAQVLLVTSDESVATMRLHTFLLVRVLTRARGH